MGLYRHGEKSRRALHDPQRKAILIPAEALSDTRFQPGDRFSIHRGRQEFFALKIVLDPRGAILFDRQGILIERTRRVDMLMGGIFDEFIVELPETSEDCLRIRPAGRLPDLGAG
ncbi:MAG: hypothetical protein ACOWWM_03815 [Desulfobacterales bacterium]